MGNKTGRQKSQEQGEGEDDMSKQQDDILNIASGPAAENLEESSKTAEEQTKDDKETQKEEDNSKPTEGTPTVNKKDEEQVSENEPQKLVEQNESELNEQAASRVDTSANETKLDLTEAKQIDCFEKSEQNKIIVSGKIYEETLSEEIKTSSEEKEQSDCTAEGSKHEFLKVEDQLKIAFKQVEVGDGHLEAAVQEEKQVAETMKKSEAVPQQEEKISNEIPTEEASSETKKQPESCIEIINDIVIEAHEEHAEASEQVQSKGDSPAVLEHVQVAESTKKYETQPHQDVIVSKDITAQDASSEQKVQQESFREVSSKDDILKVGGIRSETPEQVNVEDDQSEVEVHEQEEHPESITQNTIVHHQEDNILKDNTTHDAFCEQKEQLESSDEVSKDEVLKTDERVAEIPDQANLEDDELNPEIQKQEHVDESTEKSKTVPTLEDLVSRVSSEQKDHVESFTNEYLKADKRCTETPEQVNVEDYKTEPDVHEQEQKAKTIKKSESMPHEEENVLNEPSAPETSSVQPESIGQVSKDKVLKSVDAHVYPLQQVKSEDNQPEPEVRQEEKVAEIIEDEYVRPMEKNDSKEILSKEETTREHETHAMVTNTSFEEADLQGEKAKEAFRENAEIKRDEAGGKGTEHVELEGIADTAREQPILSEDDGIENSAIAMKQDSLD